MCTVTILPGDAPALDQPSVRIVCNRDESRSRPLAEPARIHVISGVQAVYPVDPPSKGTWIAGNERGFVFSVLNRNVRAMSAIDPTLPSRGGIIPRLLDAHSIEEIVDRSDRLVGEGYAPFRLIVVESRVLELIWSGITLVEVWHDLSQPLLFTSSGLGDDLVEGPRRRLFDAMMKPGGCRHRQQDAFHQHQWPGQEEISVRMERADARTVSTTVVERYEREVVMREGAANPLHLPMKTWVMS